MMEQTAKVWDADLGEAGRKMTVDELAALEAMHQCALLGRIAVALEDALAHLRSLEGRFDRLEQFLTLADVRYPRGRAPLPALPAVDEPTV
jgi:hypothetical protein